MTIPTRSLPACILGWFLLVPLTACEAIEGPTNLFGGEDRKPDATVIVDDGEGGEVELLVYATRSEASKQGVRYLRTEDYDPAIEQLETALKDKPEDDDILFALGAAYEASGQLEKALDAYKRAHRRKDEIRYEHAWRRVQSKME